MQIEDHAEDSTDTTSPKKPYSPPTLTVIGSVEQLTQGSAGAKTDIVTFGSL